MGLPLKVKLRPTPLAPMTANGYVPDMLNVAAIVLQNVGTTTARIFHGNYTLLPNGGVLTLNVTEDFGSMDILQLDVMFSGVGTNRVEVLTLRYGSDDTILNC